MAKHVVGFKPEQIVFLLRQIEVLTANGKRLGKQLNPVSSRERHCWVKLDEPDSDT